MAAAPDDGDVLICADGSDRPTADQLAQVVAEPVTVLTASRRSRSTDLDRHSLVVILWGEKPSDDLANLVDRASAARKELVVWTAAGGPAPPAGASPFVLATWQGDLAQAAGLDELLHQISSRRGQPARLDVPAAEESSASPPASSSADVPPPLPLDVAARELVRHTFRLRWDRSPPDWSTRIVLGALVAGTEFGSTDTGVPTGLVRVLPGPAGRRVDDALRSVGGRRGSADDLPYDVSFEHDLEPSVSALVTRLGGIAEVRAHHLLAGALSTTALPQPVLAALGVGQAILRYGLREDIAAAWPEESSQVWDEVLGPLAGRLPGNIDVLRILGSVPTIRAAQPDCPAPLAVVLAALAWIDVALDDSSTSGPASMNTATVLTGRTPPVGSEVRDIVRHAFAAVGMELPTELLRIEPSMTYLAPVLLRATAIAEATGAGAEFDELHLLAAALTAGRIPPALTAVLDADEGELRLRLRDVALAEPPSPSSSDSGWSDTEERWTEALGLGQLDTRVASDHVPVRRRRPRSDTDPAPPALEDRLDVKNYVAMLAATMMRRTTAMPLSIGLFGEWGSGKSYFMELLRQQVDTLRAPAGSTSPYVSSVVQVSFNAWNYADTNLWASLAAEFFEQLGAPDVDPDDARRAEIHAQLTEQNQLRKELTKVRDLANGRKNTARAAYSSAVAEREKQSRTFSVALADAVLADPTVEAQVSSLGRELGLRDAPAQTLQFARDVRDLADETAATRRVITRRSLRKPLLLVIAALLVTAVLPVFFPDAAGRIFGVGTFATLSAVLGSAGVVVTQSRKVLAKARELADVADRVRDDVVTTDPEVKKLAHEAHLAEADQLVAQARLTELDATVTQLERQLDDLQPGRKLYQFIAERAASSDYRGQLGVVSSVRRDFEQLVELMRRWRTAPGTQGAQQPIDRIVLYVDDLDRCEPDQVVQVLQAVHLLLAMDLFVVVVGVDPRWLLRALRQRYRGILDGAGDPGREGFDATTPQNYLEKIFQIPFVLPRMGSTGFTQLISALALPDAPSPVESHSPTPPVAGGPPAPDHATRGVAADAATEPAGSAVPTSAAGAELVPPGGTDTRSEVAGGLRAAEPTAGATVADIVATPITRRELDLLSRLAPLVRTPRSATRLFNLYSIVRSARDLSGGRQFLGAPGQPGHYQAVAQLLGVLAAEPELLGVVLWGRPGSSGPDDLGIHHMADDASWFEVVDGLEPVRANANGPWSNIVAATIPNGEVERWHRLREELTGLRDVVTLTELSPYRSWGPEVARFSFLLSPFAAEA